MQRDKRLTWSHHGREGLLRAKGIGVDERLGTTPIRVWLRFEAIKL